ncbi:MAG: dihydrofolate reductase [Bacteroidota bacterium]|nr:dihydrofolate reductase [Bacteroidota bacterium]
MKKLFIITLVITLASCNSNSVKKTKQVANYPGKIEFKLYDDPNRFADVEILRYDVPGFDALTLNQKLLVYYLSEAALCGRDMIFDQNNQHNLRIRKTLEEIYTSFEGDRNTPEFKHFEVYLKRFWMSNGIHHHYGENKIIPGFSSKYLIALINESKDAKLPYFENQDSAFFNNWLVDILFNPEIASKRVNKDNDVDPILASANNFYENVNLKEVEDFYKDKKKNDSINPISWGLNSKLIKENGKIIEKTWKVGGMYHNSIVKIIEWLEKAISVAENKEQKLAFELLIEFYKTGDLKTWDAYNIAWVNDVKSSIDFINGFIEVYHDPIGMRANYESAVQIYDIEASKRMATLAQNAQWFEDNSTIETRYKKKNVKGVTYNVVNVAMEAGDLAPSTAIGINLPNAEWIREKHGSKSVSLGNILTAYESANSGGLLREFCFDDSIYNRAVKHGQLAGKMHTALHEVIGHASGVMEKGITKDNLGAYGSTLEEARADLVALYYLLDPKLVSIKLIPTIEVGKAEYDDYIRNGLMVQLRRIQAGQNIEEDHMRNRQLVALWAYEKGKKDNVIEKKVRDGKTYFVINDYNKLRAIFGELLNIIQTIKSTGNADAGKELVETYGVKVNKNMHTEVLKRTKALDIAAYRGFIQPMFIPVYENLKIININLAYTSTFSDQMLRYSKNYGFLPLKN